MLVWVNRVVQVVSVLAVAGAVYVRVRGDDLPLALFLGVVVVVLLSVATQVLVLRSEQSSRPDRRPT